MNFQLIFNSRLVLLNCIRNLRHNPSNGLVCHRFVGNKSDATVRCLANVCHLQLQKPSIAKTLSRRTPNWSLTRRLCSTTPTLDTLTYERISDHTLDQLTDELEIIVETNEDLKDADVSLSNGVITLKLGSHGVYVINKQSPNKQIWLSSPVSGPKRYDYLNNEWIYKRDGISLHTLLSKELSMILKREVILTAD